MGDAWENASFSRKLKNERKHISQFEVCSDWYIDVRMCFLKSERATVTQPEIFHTHSSSLFDV